MKPAPTLLMTIALAIGVFLQHQADAQVPEKMSYQAVIRNSSNQLVTNQSVGMKISILQGSVGGTVVYFETRTPTTNANGMVTMEIGGEGFNVIDWANGPFFIKTETDPTGGTSYTITGTSQILSIPYAIYAKTSATSADAVKITGDQTIAGNKTFTASINAGDNRITHVATPMGDHNAANKAYVDSLFNNIEVLLTKIKDVDGNLYAAVKIGDQIWMKENLRTTRYNDNTDIPLVVDGSSWIALNTPGFCWYDNDDAKNKYVYGALYNWYTVNTGKLCPAGWHVPSDEEWTILTTYLGGESVAGGKLKESGTTHWSSPNAGAINSSDFAALPGGNRDSDGTFYSVGYYGHWWSTTEFVGATVWLRGLYYDFNSLGRVYYAKKDAYSVRCIKD